MLKDFTVKEAQLKHILSVRSFAIKTGDENMTVTTLMVLVYDAF